MQQSSLRQRLSGVFTALVTPMQDGALDLSAFERHVASQLDAGIHGLVPVGTTGEAATLSRAEIARLIGSTVALAGGNAFVMAGVGSNSTTTTIDNARHAADLGVDGLLVVTPYYNKPSQNGLFDHFAASGGGGRPADHALQRPRPHRRRACRANRGAAGGGLPEHRLDQGSRRTLASASANCASPAAPTSSCIRATMR